MRVLIVDDDDGIRWLLSRIVREEGFDVAEAATLHDGINHPPVDLVFLDVFLPDGNGMEALANQSFASPVIMLTAETTFDHAAEAYQSGAFEYLPKPFDVNEVRQLLRRFREQAANAPKHQQTAPANSSLIMGRSPAMQQLFRTLAKVAPTDLTVLITGESGTGKELVAQELHQRSKRSDSPFIAINTAAIPAELLEAELFGHDKGAFTGADKARQGRFVQAHGGTLFLDEIGDMPAALQSKLLRVLETGKVQPVGSREERAVDVRLLAATHQDLQEKIHGGLFREDLYYRLNVIPVHIPPLRERPDDIPELAERFLQQAARELALDSPVLADDAVTLLMQHRWDGNVRELKNVMRRLTILTPGISIGKNDVALAIGSMARNEPQPGDALEQAVVACIRDYINHLGHAEITQLHAHLIHHVEPPLLRLALKECQGHQLNTAAMLGLNRNTLRKLLRQYDIDAADYH
jgi:two-component system nitrogen regulation response regulator GlnG